MVINLLLNGMILKLDGLVQPPYVEKGCCSRRYLEKRLRWGSQIAMMVVGLKKNTAPKQAEWDKGGFLESCVSYVFFYVFAW